MALAAQLEPQQQHWGLCFKKGCKSPTIERKTYIINYLDQLVKYTGLVPTTDYKHII